MRRIHISDQVTAATLEPVVKRGIALIWWSSQHVSESRDIDAIGSFLLDLAKRNKLDFAALLSIRIAIICMFEGISHDTKARVIQDNRKNVLYQCIPEDTHDLHRLFLAFESAVLWTSRSNKYRARVTRDMCSENFMHDVYGTMIDRGLVAVIRLIIRQDNAVSRVVHKYHLGKISKLWTDLPALLVEKASSDQVLKDLLGPDLDGLTTFEVYDRIKNTMTQEELAKEVLKHLDLDTVGRRTPLSAAAFEVPSLRYWQIWHPA